MQGIKRKFGEITLKKIVTSTPPEKKIKLTHLKERGIEKELQKYNCAIHDNDQSICRLYECSGVKYSTNGLKFENLSIKKERKEVGYIS